MSRDDPGDRPVRRIVFDTSTLVSAALRPGSIPHRALVLGMRHCEVCASQQTLDELRSVLHREKFDRYLPLPSRMSFARVVESGVRLFVMRGDRTFPGPRCRDAHDDQFLELAFEAGADAIVSSDDDLLAIDPWNSVRILRPAEFLTAIARER